MNRRDIRHWQPDLGDARQLLDEPSEQVVNGLMQRPLNSLQKQKLAALARRVYDAGPCQSGETFEEWRHDQVRELTGKSGLRALNQADFKTVRGHFLQLAKKAGAAFRSFAGLPQQPRELALAKLQRECASPYIRERLPEAMQYAQGFLKRNRGKTLADADERDLTHAMFCVRRKVQAMRKKGEYPHEAD